MNPMPPEVQAAVERLRTAIGAPVGDGPLELVKFVSDMAKVTYHIVPLLPSGPRPEVFHAIHEGEQAWYVDMGHIEQVTASGPTQREGTPIRREGWVRSLYREVYRTKSDALSALAHDLFDAYVREMAEIRERLDVLQNRKETR